MIKNLVKKIKLILPIIAIFVSITVDSAYSKKPQIEFKDSGIIVSDISSIELQALFSSLNYDKYIHMPEWKYPPVFLKQMPYDFKSIKERNDRINLFIRIMVPLALRINEEIRMERLELLEIRTHFNDEKDLTEEHIKKLEALAEKYDVFTRFKGFRRYNRFIQELDEKINIVPPSILIANAAIETNWGESEALEKANSLYKELVWYTDEGLEVDDAKDDSYRIKIFPDLISSMRSFALKINSNVNYEIFRHSRANILNRDKPVIGRDVAHNMYYSSNIKNFIGLLNYTLTFYELMNIDSATLGFPKKKN